ncbi:uncharacterized protein SOCEGT47_018950 [Sorangium cellulosum]|uniref:Uncharacterized protein n=1 Tax=Sorangium cellulosum TaxID=56 RepID=A0A4P2PXP3_SORCE|nr:hypothetical protein [Sorangium cellulosum]AUX21411.1 uncharacterized protein SOCEGT47_018950 [Sorangium cellulosum]
MRLRGMVLLIVGLGCVSCAKSEEEIQEEFDAIVAESNACSDASECVHASAGCPLGCAVPVNRARKAYVEEKARELIEDYERWGRGCAHDCGPPRPLECAAGRCQAIISP